MHDTHEKQYIQWRPDSGSYEPCSSSDVSKYWFRADHFGKHCPLLEALQTEWSTPFAQNAIEGTYVCFLGEADRGSGSQVSHNFIGTVFQAVSDSSSVPPRKQTFGKGRSIWHDVRRRLSDIHLKADAKVVSVSTLDLRNFHKPVRCERTFVVARVGRIAASGVQPK